LDQLFAVVFKGRIEEFFSDYLYVMRDRILSLCGRILLRSKLCFKPLSKYVMLELKIIRMKTIDCDSPKRCQEAQIEVI
jgi:hypothetical protein